MDIILLLFGLVSGLIASFVRLAKLAFGMTSSFIRLDVCISPAEQKTDTGYGAYCASVMLDHTFNNPVKIVFLKLRHSA